MEILKSQIHHSKSEFLTLFLEIETMEAAHYFSEAFSKEFLSIPITVHTGRKNEGKKIFADFCGCSLKKPGLLESSIVSSIREYSSIGEKFEDKEELRSVIFEITKKVSSFAKVEEVFLFAQQFSDAMIGMIHFEGKIALSFSKRLARYLFLEIKK